MQVARTVTLTIFVYVVDPAIATWFRKRMRAFVAKHPARLVLLDATGAQPTVQAQDASPAFLELAVADIDAETLRAYAHEQLIEDVPSILAWAGGMLGEDSRFVALDGLTDALLIDASRGNSSTLQLHALSTYVQSHPNRAVNDLSYLRLLPWQDVIAGFFDDRDAMDDLFALRSVEIAAGSSAEAYYLLGWLASRLDWRPHDKKTLRARDGNEVSFAIATSGIARRIHSVTLRSNRQIFTATAGQDDLHRVCLETDAPGAADGHWVPLQDISSLELFERAVLERSTLPLYHETLDLAHRIAMLVEGKA